MNWPKLLSVFILCCLGGTTVNTFAQTRPLRQTQHHAQAQTPAQTPEQVKAAAAAAQAKALQAQAEAAAAQAQAQAAQSAAAQAAETQAQVTSAAQAAAVHAQAAPQAEAAQAQEQAAQAQEQAAATAQTTATAVQAAQAAAVQAAAAQAVAAKAAAQAATTAAAAAAAAAAPVKQPDTFPCWAVPASHCYSTDDNIKGVNDFFGTADNYSFINQVKSIYNGASGTTTVSADIASLNFPLGLQLIFGTNVQAGVTTPATVTSGSTATLAPTSAAQAAQNMIYGGTFSTALLFPLIYHGLENASSPGGVVFSMDAIGKGGVDIQNFKSGTSTTVSNPPTHANLGIESYLQLNSANVADATNNILGDVFVGGSYGYNYASHGYARDYGFGKRVSSGVGQLVIGAMLTKIATITISRGFGPSQIYIDSTSTSVLPTRVNTFKAWSFGLTYQKPAQAPAS
jgi:hypothetical protein